MGTPVIQEWVTDLTFMQQTVLISAIRGCDGMAKYHKAKPLLKWYRRCVVLSAFDGKVLDDPFIGGGGSFSGPIGHESMGTDQRQRLLGEVVDDFIVSRDEIPLHYFTHCMHGFQIAGYYHPIPWVRSFWCEVYVRMVHAMHLWAETKEQMDKRLGDTMEGWKAREDAAGSCST